MKYREIAVIIFYDDNGYIYLQDRTNHSKFGEKYGFWGGGINPNETPLLALKREIQEELGVVLGKVYFLDEFNWTFPKENWQIKIFAFYSKLNFDIQKTNITEGNGFHLVKLNDALNDPEFDPHDKEVLLKFKDKHLIK